MTKIYDGRLYVHYGQAYVASPQCEEVLPDDAFVNQENGLCGAGIAGALFLVTGLHTGEVSLVVEVLKEEPALDEQWEEVVEVSFRPKNKQVCVRDWNFNTVCDLPLERIDYRVRYCAKGFGLGEQTPPGEEREPGEVYSLQFWPAPRGRDVLVRQTREKAIYWHQVPRV